MAEHYSPSHQTQSGYYEYSVQWLHHADRRRDGREGGRMAVKNGHMKKRNQNHWDDKCDKNFSSTIAITGSASNT